MNRVVASICMAGVLGTVYYAYPTAAQDNKDVVETPKKAESSKSDDSIPQLRDPSFKETPTYREESPKSSNRPKDAPFQNPADAFGRLNDNDVDLRPRAGVPGAFPGPGLPHHFGSGHQGRDVMFRRRLITRQVQEEIAEPIPPEEQEEHKQFRGAIQQLKEAKDDANKKDEVAKTIRELLNKQFERDLAHRESELAAVEERVKTLRKQLDKRKSAKDEIISLRVKTIVNDVDGLGFPGEEGYRDGPTVRGLPDTVNFEQSPYREFGPRANPGKPGAPVGVPMELPDAPSVTRPRKR